LEIPGVFLSVTSAKKARATHISFHWLRGVNPFLSEVALAGGAAMLL
jgi:hypothetical protein